MRKNHIIEERHIHSMATDAVDLLTDIEALILTEVIVNDRSYVSIAKELGGSPGDIRRIAERAGEIIARALRGEVALN